MGIMLQVILGMFQFLLLSRIPTSHAKVCIDHLTSKACMNYGDQPASQQATASVLLSKLVLVIKWVNVLNQV